MEFRCPACNTSYRVPVRLDQQVRCARCNHVWRITESDFVMEDDAPDESEMPEAFSSPGADDMDEELDEQPAAQQPDHDSMTARFDERGAWDAGRQGEARAEEAGWPEQDEDEDAQQWDSQHEAERFARHDLSVEDDASDAAIDESYDSGPTEEDAQSFDRRLADSWFSNMTEQPGDAERGDAASHASFERIMEGIEEVIAESSGGGGSAAARDEHESDDPLRALMNEERIHNFGGSLQDQEPQAEQADESGADPWGGKVVRLAARGGDRRVEGRAQDENRRREDDGGPAQGGASAEPMADLIDKIASGRAEASDFAEPEFDGKELPGAAQVARAADAIRDAHFEALQADLEDAAHAVAHGSENGQDTDVAETWASEGYHDEEHEEAQRESLAFDTGQQAFDTSDRFDHSDDDADQRLGDFEPNDTRDHDWRDDGEPLHDEPADIFAAGASANRSEDNATTAMDARDDDVLLAEYDFGDAETETPPDEAEQARRGAGTLTVAAAWALFLAIMAGATVAVVAFRDQVADALPASGPVYAAIGLPVDPPPLVFGDVSYSWDERTPNTLILSGQVKNNRSELTEVPNMQITARNDNGEVVAEESKVLEQPALLPGETYNFRINFEVSPDELRTLELRF